MNRLMHRLTILSAVTLLSLLIPRPLHAQDPLDLPFDFLYQRMHEWKLERDEGRLQEDINRGDTIGVNRDLQRIQRDERLLWWDRRRIRRDMWLPPGPTRLPSQRIATGVSLIPHPQYPGYGYYPSNPAQLYQLPQPAASASGAVTTPAMSVVIKNAGTTGTAIEYVVDGIRYRTEGGQNQGLSVTPGSTILYDRGGDLGQQRYVLSAGTYEFRTPDDARWALFKLKPPPQAAGAIGSAIVPRNELPILTTEPQTGEPAANRSATGR